MDNEIKKQVTAELDTAMIFAAGLGTRLKPWTDHHPKALAVVNGKPLLQRNIEYLKSYGIQNIVINVHHFADQVFDFLRKNNNFGCAIQVSHEKEEALETGGGLQFAEPLLKNAKRFLVINADILTDLNIDAMLRFHLQHKPLATLAVTSRSSSRGFLFNEKQQLCGWRNNTTGEERVSIVSSVKIPMAFSGIHIIEQTIFPLITESGKFSMVDLYLRLCKDHPVIGYDHSNDILVDVGKPESIAIAEQYFV